MTPHWHWFVPGTYKQLDVHQKIHFSDNSFVEALGTGTVRVMSKLPGKEREIMLTYILHIPTFSLTLVSVHHLKN
ncbi:hypothetical protein K439DRAFT_1331889 [Ramaria rubella]|nr:hypothetical protein K439DRAFT_1331889 [Ramaria rubella]